MTKKLKEYLNNVYGVSQITFNPNGPGAVRVHLIPPKKVKLGIAWVVIINGQDVLPVTTGWGILLREFINNAICYDGKEANDAIIKKIINDTTKTMSELFPKTKVAIFKSDLRDIVDTLTKIAKGETPSVAIGYMSLKKYAKYMQAPHRIDLMISSMNKDGNWHCNQKCLHCYAGEQIEARTNEISTDEWKKIIDKCKDAMIPQITFTGGEPTLRSDLVELVNYSSWFVTRLNTNGVLLTKKLCEELKEASLDSVQITLYSADENIHNKLVGANNYQATIKGIKNAVETGLNVSINTPLCKLNENYRETIKLVKDLGVMYFSCSGMIMTGNSQEEYAKETYLTKAEISKIVAEVANYCYNNNLEISFTSPGWISTDKLNELKLVVPSCGACLSNMAVAPNGDVIPCQSWLNGDVLGNLLTDSFSKIWNSKKCKNIRKQSRTKEEICLLANGKEKQDEKSN